MKNEKVQAALDSVEASLAELAAETDAFQQSERWKTILDNVSKFHNYSIFNQLLIASQRKDATYVAGFVRWKSLGRQVVKGAKGIAILVPCKMKSKPTLEEDMAEIPAETVKKAPSSFIWFRTGYVFDISDTTGKPLGLLDLPPVVDDNGKLPLVEAAVKSLGIGVQYEEFDTPGLSGVSKDGNIIIRESLPAGDKASVFIHEAAHTLLHWGENYERALEIGKETREVEAESTAYVVMRYLGIASTANLYLTSYGADGSAIKAALGRVRDASSRIIGAIEQVRKTQADEAVYSMPLAA